MIPEALLFILLFQFYSSRDHSTNITKNIKITILHAIDVTESNLFRRLIVSSPDTDVFLLLIHYHASIPPDTQFLTGSGDKTRLI